MTPCQKAQQGLALVKQAIIDLIEEHPNGLRNAEIAEKLDLHSDYLGSQKDYLSWSVLGLLLNQGTIVRRGKLYFLAPTGKTPL